MFDLCDDLRVLVPFFREPSRRFHLRELARIFEWGPGRVKRCIGEHVEDGLIVERMRKVFLEYYANLESEDFVKLKRVYNRFVLSGLVEFLNKELAYPEAIILFGSYEMGEDVEGSDIDLCVVGEEASVGLGEFEKRLNRSINILFLDKNKLERAKENNPELVNNLVNGTLLSGYFKVF